MRIADQGERDRAREDRADWDVVRRRCWLGYLVALALIVAFAGVPTDRFSLLALILAALGIGCLGRGWRAFGRVLLDWVPFYSVLIAYDYTRGIAHRLGIPLHIADVAALDRRVFGQVPSVYLQDHFYDVQHVHWWDAVATLVYTSHFLATPIIAAVIYRRNRRLWLSFVRRVIALALAGVITYIAVPTAPPWYAAQLGVIAPVVRGTSRGWTWLHLSRAGNLVKEGQYASNLTAAIPSLHTAYATMITLFVLGAARSRWRWLLVVYPFVMGLSLVYLGEHYVTDVVIGAVYGAAVEIGMRRWERRRGGPGLPTADAATDDAAARVPAGRERVDA